MKEQGVREGPPVLLTFCRGPCLLVSKTAKRTCQQEVQYEPHFW